MKLDMSSTGLKMTFAACMFSLLGAACGGPAAFSGDVIDNDPKSLNSALSRQSKSGGDWRVVNSTGRPTAYLVTTPNPTRKVIAWDIEGKKAIWSVDSDATSRVTVGPNVVVYRQGSRDGSTSLIARAVTTGRQVWQKTIPGELLGVAIDSGRVYVSVQTAAGRSSVVQALSADSGELLWSKPAQGTVGAPAARSGDVFIPYLTQYLIVADGRTGRDLATLRQTDEAISFVRAVPSGVVYGGARVFSLDSKSAAGTVSGMTHANVVLPAAFSDLSFQANAYATVSANYTALDRVRLLWQPSLGGDNVDLAEDTVVAQFHRFFFGLSPKDGTLKWAHRFPRVDVVSADSNGGALVYVGANGKVGALNVATGYAESLGEVGTPLSGGTFDLGSYAAPTGAGTEVERELVGIIVDPDRSYDHVKSYAVEELAKSQSPQATEQLVKLVATEGVSPEVYATASKRLVDRVAANDLSVLTRQLAVRYNYVTGAKAFGVDVLADAVSAPNVREAAKGASGNDSPVALLVSHLQDAETASSSLPSVVKALGKLGGDQALEALSAFVLTYRADTEFGLDPTALTDAVEQLLKVGGPRERDLLEYVAGEENTLEKVKQYTLRALEK